MRLNTFAIIWSVLYGVFGLGLLTIPDIFMSTYGVNLDPGGAMMTRILGAALTAFALVFWMNRKLPVTDPAWRNLLVASVIYNVVDIPIVVTATLDGVMNAMGWIPAILHVFLAVTQAYFAFRRQ